MHIKLNYKNISNLISKDGIFSTKDYANQCRDILLSKTGEGHDFLGWLDYPINLDLEEYNRIKIAAKKIQSDSEVLVVIGIGGSYLGAKAIIESLKHYFKKSKTEVIFAGNSLSSTYLAELVEYLEDKSFSINVISKSGTTTEPAIAFRALKELLYKKHPNDADSRIFATTDAHVGALRTLADSRGYETFIVPDDIGGRYSWITAVGLLPVCVAGCDIDELIRGAKDARNECINTPFEDNASMLYATSRYLLSKSNKSVEVLVSYEPKLSFISEWWKQLFGESEGKDLKGIFPSSLVYSTDLHSLGQYIQEGQRIMFETILDVNSANKDITLGSDLENLDKLNYLSGKTLDYVNKMAMKATLLAHVDGGVPNLILSVDKVDEYNIGYLLFFFMYSCAISCYMTGVNPFNQPGVESYKKNMFGLLEKPGYENLTEDLKKRLK